MEIKTCSGCKKEFVWQKGSIYKINTRIKPNNRLKTFFCCSYKCYTSIGGDNSKDRKKSK